jgi:hypothetical protein
MFIHTFVQESIPWRGDLQSYFISITYINNPDSLFVPLTADAVDQIDYSFKFVNLKADVGLPWIKIGIGIQYVAAFLLIFTLIIYLR